MAKAAGQRVSAAQSFCFIQVLTSRKKKAGGVSETAVSSPYAPGRVRSCRPRPRERGKQMTIDGEGDEIQDEREEWIGRAKRQVGETVCALYK